ncbi:small ribosomal subunit Rsm22 family protein [Terrabacter sp. NPDC000476]|uniref:small ribosomal subunit Rsm22 family protein n=1 Tax=Terrabacter sp. NPDC000476 TaxID=3154258 RepID=UPI00333163B1
MSRTPPYAADLRAALARVSRGVDERELARATEVLVSRYRSVAPAGAPILASDVHVAAYAAYRMPATHAALGRVLGELADRGLAPRTMFDLGGGTGAAAWAAAGAFDELERVTVLDQVEAALALGRRLVEGAAAPALAAASFARAVAGRWPEADVDLVTVSYVLSELDEGEQQTLVADAMRRGGCVVVVEPGTPDGYARVIRARDALLAAGWHLVGPCPHSADCPLSQGDWCHFAARVNRSAEHRRLKGAELSYEDEKFSWVAAVAPGTPAPEPRSGRILRHPLKRKGFVEFQVCRPDGTAGREVVSKKAGERYREARDAEWGDLLP